MAPVYLLEKLENIFLTASLISRFFLFQDGENGEKIADKWRVQNSWGDTDGDKGM